MKMKLTLALVLCSLPAILIAQTDSTWLDLGRIKLKKDFTQTVSIKGKDLEQMPFASLDEAINVWLNGIATNRLTVVYVIDGNMITDVNAYTIHDIEEITLVQNALVQLNGAIREKQLILITTKKNRPNKSGVSVAGSTFAVKNKNWYAPNYKYKSETNYFHRYDISAWRNNERVQYGITAGFLRDVLPYAGNAYTKMEKTFQVNRFRFNGYLNANLDAKNNVWLRAGYVPGTYKVEYKNSDWNDSRVKENESFFAVEAGWTSRIAKRVTNEFSAGFTPGVNKEKSIHLSLLGGGPTTQLEKTINRKYKFNNLLLSDHWTYHGQAGDWLIEPSLNLSYRNISIKNTENIVDRNRATGDIIGVINTESKSDYSVFLLTPSLNVVYKDLFSIQGGFVYNLSGDQDPGTPEATKLLPYITLGADVLKIAKVNSKLNWKVFGSYAAAGNFGDAAFMFNEAAGVEILYPYPERDYSYYLNTGTPIVYGGDSVNYAIQAGTTIGWLNGRIQASYNFEKRRYATMAYFNTFPSGMWLPINMHHSIHRLGITARVVEGPALTWQTGLNVTSIKSKTEFRTLTGPIIPSFNKKYDKPLYTGGFTNRLQYKKFMAGLDLLYIFNIGKYSGTTIDNKQKALSIRNLYAGYQLQLKNKPLEVYIATRNPAQPDESMMPDKQTYWGAGFKAAL